MQLVFICIRRRALWNCLNESFGVRQDFNYLFVFAFSTSMRILRPKTGIVTHIKMLICVKTQMSRDQEALQLRHQLPFLTPTNGRCELHAK
jgi:hypothetical protein